mmetsp:Transcript_4895/g.11484  ORF Transcript_4895/g.11484 Transcript_4895/m.11484 type:complete len:404 (+) Transcript_4895:56-1267(+)
MASLLIFALWTAFSMSALSVEEVWEEMSLLQRSVLVSSVQQGTPTVPLLQQGSSHAAGRRVRTIPSININLDLPPEERWVTALGSALLRQLVGGWGGPVDKTLVEDVDFTPDEEFLAEMRGIVKHSGNPFLTVEHLLEGEVGYERGFTACTGVLVATSNGTVFHGRNLDLQPNLRDALQSCTFDATFYRGGKPLFSATLMGVGIGIHTGYRIGSYSIAQNTRQGCGDVDLNVEAARRGGRPFPLLVRRILQDVASYDEAVHRLAETPLIAPQYFTVAGAGAWEGSLVTRDRHGYSAPYPNVETLSPQIGRWFIVQTNDDTWKPPVDERRPTALAKLSSMGPSSTSAETVLEVMTTEPVLNTGTVFTWVLQPSTGARKVFLGSDELRGDVAVPAFVSNIRPPTR